MKQNKLLRYFKSYLLQEAICALVFLVGFIINRYLFEIRVLGRPIMVIGVIGFVFFLLLRISDARYETYFTSSFDKMPKERDLEPEYVASEYSFEGNHFARLDKSNAARSEIYVRTVFYFDKQLKLVKGVVNLEKGTKDFETFAFDHATAELEQVEHMVGKTKKIASIMTITDGEKTCRFPVRYNDIEVDHLIEKLNRKYSQTA